MPLSGQNTKCYVSLVLSFTLQLIVITQIKFVRKCLSKMMVAGCWGSAFDLAGSRRLSRESGESGPAGTGGAAPGISVSETHRCPGSERIQHRELLDGKQ